MTLLPIADKVSNNQDSVVANAFNNEPNMRKLQLTIHMLEVSFHDLAFGFNLQSYYYNSLVTSHNVLL